jgi:hypothetical protein
MSEIFLLHRQYSAGLFSLMQFFNFHYAFKFHTESILFKMYNLTSYLDIFTWTCYNKVYFVSIREFSLCFNKSATAI